VADESGFDFRTRKILSHFHGEQGVKFSNPGIQKYKYKEILRWGDPGVDGRIMLGWTFKKWDVGVRTGLGWLRIGIGGGRL
jgi:hypothetical protein